MDNYELHFNPDSQELAISVNESKFDAASVSEFRRVVDEFWNPETLRVAIDFSEVDFIDSSGIGALLSIHKRLQHAGNPVEIHHAKPNVVSVIELLRLHNIFYLK